jgi:hypothetical protein
MLNSSNLSLCILKEKFQYFHEILSHLTFFLFPKNNNLHEHIVHHKWSEPYGLCFSWVICWKIAFHSDIIKVISVRLQVNVNVNAVVTRKNVRARLWRRWPAGRQDFKFWWCTIMASPWSTLELLSSVHVRKPSAVFLFLLFRCFTR